MNLRFPGPVIAALALAAVGGAGQRALAQPASGTDQETIRLSPFQVSSESDTGYAVDQTVSATRTATKLANLPLSISVVTDQFLSDLAASDIDSALLYENVTTPQTDAFSSNVDTSFVIRGFTAATMHDGFLMAGGTTPVATIAVDRVEVIKGPESLLYGEMNPGGLVNIVSKQPSATPETVATGFYGSYDNRGGSLDTTGPLSSDGRFTYRIMGDVDYSNALQEETAYQRKEWVAMLGAQLTPNLDLKVEYDVATNYVIAPSQEAFFVQLGTDPAGRGTQEEYLLPGQDGAPGPTYNYRGPGTYGNGLERYFMAELSQSYGGNWNARLAFATIWDTAGRMTNKIAAQLPTANANAAYTYTDTTTTVQSLQYDLTNTWNFAGVEWKFLAGASADTAVSSAVTANSTFSYTKINVLVPSTWPQPWPPVSPAPSTFTGVTANGGSVSKDAAVYTSQMVSLLQERLHLLAGARYQRAEATAFNYLPPGSKQGYSEDATIYELGALYQLLRPLGVYYSWSQSFLPQNEVLLSPKPIDPATGLPVAGSTNGTFAAQPLAGEGHEFGFKVEMLDSRLNLTASYYDVRESNVVQTRVIVNPANGETVDEYQVQSGAEWSQGLEFGLVGKPCPSVDLMVNYNQPFSGVLLSDVTTPTYVGKELQNNPKEQLSTFAKYTQLDGALKGAYLGLGGRYWGDSQAFAPTQPQLATLPPYFVMDGLAGYRFRLGKFEWWVQLNASNLLDRHVLFSGYSYSGDTTYRITLGVRF